MSAAAAVAGASRFQRSALWYFAALAGAAVAAFWPTYFAAPPFDAAFYLPSHVHGVAMFGWFALLLAQASLARRGRVRDHRLLGRIGYVLVPVIALSTVWLAQARAHAEPTSPVVVYFLYVQLSLMAFFVLCYAWAMTHRRQPFVHMRYIAGTALAAVDPIFARILYNALQVEPPMLQAITYCVVGALLAFLWWTERAKPPFARAWRRMLVTFLVLVLPTFFVTQTAAWRSVVAAFGGA
jgi:hypothetical protein